MGYSREEALASRDELIEAQMGCKMCFEILAHDASLLGVVDTFPSEADGWKEKGRKDSVL